MGEKQACLSVFHNRHNVTFLSPKAVDYFLTQISENLVTVHLNWYFQWYGTVCKEEKTLK